jgi:hypothetical protein
LDTPSSQRTNPTIWLTSLAVYGCCRTPHSFSQYSVQILIWLSNRRAWILLRQILDKDSYIKSQVPHDIVSWITEESIQSIEDTSSFEVDEIKKEVNELERTFEETSGANNEENGFVNGWKKWKGNWIRKPFGIGADL